MLDNRIFRISSVTALDAGCYRTLFLYCMYRLLYLTGRNPKRNAACQCFSDLSPSIDSLADCLRSSSRLDELVGPLQATESEPEPSVPNQLRLVRPHRPGTLQPRRGRAVDSQTGARPVRPDPSCETFGPSVAIDIGQQEVYPSGDRSEVFRIQRRSGYGVDFGSGSRLGRPVEG